ncbi:hypothetical protein Q1695_015390 [Nippostrongylus brasiliensis]|nr:hypothetical protein Q1695_015390 [Nippostrongylus brasiliensis]
MRYGIDIEYDPTDPNSGCAACRVTINFRQLIDREQGTYADFVEGLKVFDKEECGKILCAELRHILLALGERLSTDEVDELLKGVEDAEGLVKYEDFIKKVLAGPFPDSD